MRIGIDLGGTKTEGIVMDDQGEILHRLRLATPQAEGYDAILNTVEQLVLQLEAKLGKTCSVGIGTPGSISSRTGLIRNSNTTCLNGKRVQADLQSRLQRDIPIANDANCFALSEAVDGAAQGAEVVFGVIIGTGTGGGIVIKQQVVNGAQHIAGEWGHNPLYRHGSAEKRDCYCGRQDCIETYLSGAGLMQTYHRAGGKQAQSVPQVVVLAQTNDTSALTALARYQQHFGQALASVVNVLDPDVIVLGGGLSNIDSLYTEGFEAMKPHIFSDFVSTRIVKNQHGDSSGVRGAAWLWGQRRS